MEQTALSRRLLRPHVGVDGIGFHARNVEVVTEGRKVSISVTVEVRAPDQLPEQWLVTFPPEDVDADLYWTGTPESIDELVKMLHIHLEEWWHTRRSEAHARKMGKRID